LIQLIEPDPELRRVALRTPEGFFAFGFGSGLSHHAPGTAGTVAAIPFALLLKQLPLPVFWVALAALFFVGVYLCGAASRMLGRHDPGNIVWDEMSACSTSSSRGRSAGWTATSRAGSGSCWTT